MWGVYVSMCELREGEEREREKKYKIYIKILMAVIFRWWDVVILFSS